MAACDRIDGGLQTGDVVRSRCTRCCLRSSPRFGVLRKGRPGSARARNMHPVLATNTWSRPRSGRRGGTSAMVEHPALPFLRRNEKGKIVSAADAVNLIRDGDTLATGGFVGIGFAEEIAAAIEQRFVGSGDPDSQTAGHPRDLTLVSPAGQGDGGG